MERFGNILEGFKSEYKPFEVPPLERLKIRDNIIKFPGNNRGQFSEPIKGDEELIKGIRKRADGRYEARITIKGKRVSLYAKTQAECLKMRTALRKANRTTKISPRKVKLFDFAKEWLEVYKKQEVGDGSYKIYKNAIFNHIVALNKPIEEYSIAELQEFLNTKGTTRTKEILFQTIKQIYRKAFELELIKKDISQFLIKGKVERKEKTSFTLEEQKTILANLKNNTISKYILAYLMLGARLSELSTIKKENIKKNNVLIEGTKTKNAKRWVRISDRYEKILLSYNEPIFNCQPETIKAKMKEFFKKIGINGSTHILRHTFSTNLYYLGVDDLTRKQYLGHGSIVVTNDIYTHLDPTITKADILEIYGDLYPNF